MGEVFKKMPKGNELHTHYSSIIDYDWIIRDILEVYENRKYANQLCWGVETYRDQQKLSLFFRSELKRNQV